jgi:hypothetical protein
MAAPRHRSISAIGNRVTVVACRASAGSAQAPRRVQALTRGRCEAVGLRVGTKPGNRILHRHHGLDEGVVVAKQAGARLQDVAVEGGLGKREIEGTSSSPHGLMRSCRFHAAAAT